mmetsp:Transcript_14926/g.32552  ORF Transcript_14926/g.32552 Transcript_14926/m.32552 type:complete len:123 (+) Transcript_14926:188-556(+)
MKRTLTVALVILGIFHMSAATPSSPSIPKSSSTSLRASHGKIATKQPKPQQQHTLQTTTPCSCFPRSFTITHYLSNTCDVDTVDPNSGIGCDSNSGIVGADLRHCEAWDNQATLFTMVIWRR